jgi:hypothetical protein
VGLKLTISFKDTEEEKKLYEWITEHSNYSGFVKDILKEKKKGPAKETNKEEKFNLINF